MKAKADYHLTVVELRGVIDDGRAKLSRGTSVDGPWGTELTPDEINAASCAHFRQMVVSIRGKNMSPDGGAAVSRRERINAAHEMRSFQLDTAEREHWVMMSAQASWLCVDLGWKLNPKGPTFMYLCQAMLRARIQA